MSERQSARFQKLKATIDALTAKRAAATDADAVAALDAELAAARAKVRAAKRGGTAGAPAPCAVCGVWTTRTVAVKGKEIRWCSLDCQRAGWKDARAGRAPKRTPAADRRALAETAVPGGSVLAAAGPPPPPPPPPAAPPTAANYAQQSRRPAKSSRAYVESGRNASPVAFAFAAAAEPPSSSRREVVAVFACEGDADGELSFAAGDVIALLDDASDDGWWKGELAGTVGVFPASYVEPRTPPPPPLPPRPTSVRADPADGGDAPRTARVCVAVYDCAADAAGDLAFSAGDLIDVLDDTDPDWWRGARKGGGAAGAFPASYVKAAP